MRLFLHGKSTRSVLLDQLSHVRQVVTKAEAEAVAVASQHTEPLSLILWFSQWNFGSSHHEEVEHQLMDLLVLGSPSSSSSSSLGGRKIRLTKVIVQNCHTANGTETAADTDSDANPARSSMASSLSNNLWSILLHHTKSLTIRYDTQQDQLCLPVFYEDYDGIDEFNNNNYNNNNGDYYPLEELELEGVTLSEQSLAVLEDLCSQAAPQLKRLYITSHWTTLEVNYQHRSILGREADVEPHLTLLCQFLQSSCMSHLKVLELVHCHLVDSCLAELLKHVLPVSSDSSSSSTTIGTRMQLESLNLRGNMAKEKTLKVIAQSLLHPHCSLSHLDLGEQRQYYSTNNLHHDPTCHHSPPLPVDRLSIRMMEHLGEGIEGNCSLRSLSLAKNQFCSTTSLPNLLQALCRRRNNNVFQHLDLQDCGLSSRDVQGIAQALAQPLRLRSLDLSGQQRVSGHKVKRALVGPLLSSNPYLCKIQLPQNVESKSIEWMLEWNRIGRRAVLHAGRDFGDSTTTTAAVPANVWPTLLERANRMCQHYPDEETSTRHSASAIYYLLRQGGCDVLAGSTDNRADTVTASPSHTDVGGCYQYPSPPFSKVQTRASLPLPPTPSTFMSPETILPRLGDSENIELSFVVLEESSSFEKPSTVATTMHKTRHHMLTVQVDIPEPSGALERPRLSSTRGSPLSNNFVPVVAPRIAWGAE